MKNVLYISLSLLIFTACSKDQKAVNNLEGTWTRTGLAYNGVVVVDSSSTTYTFEKCKVSKDDCPGEMISDGKTLAFTYNFSEKGEKFTLTVLETTAVDKGCVVEQTDDTFIFKYTDASSGVQVEETLTK